MAQGMFYEDFEIGQEFETSTRTVTEADIVNFAGLSGDYNLIHVDEEFAKKTIFQGRIAHGLLGLAIGSGLFASMGLMKDTGIAFLGLTWKFTGPIKIGDTIGVKIKVAEKRETKAPDRGLVVLERKIVNQRGEVVQEGQTTLMVKRKGS